MDENMESQSKTIQPFRYRGSLQIPASKSYLQRAIAIASLCEETCSIENYYPSADAQAAVQIAQKLGADIRLQGNNISVKKGITNLDEVELHCGESGLSTRMFSPIAALFDRKTIIKGSGSMLKRPIQMIEDALRQFGVETQSESGYLPLTLQGKMRGGKATINGSESSQLLTGLLIALPLLEEDNVLIVSNLKSKPYIQMTLDLLAKFGIAINHENFETFHIPGRQTPKATHYSCEGDWSGAAFHLVGAAISGDITLYGLNAKSSQADRAIMEALRKCGAEVVVEDNQITVRKNKLLGFQFDATDCPDLFPPLAVLAACCEGESIIKGVSRLANKESNRALSIQTEFAKLNVQVHLERDFMRIGKSTILGGQVDSHNDHRIAMATAIFASVSSEPIAITNSQAVDKSYPTFFDDLDQIIKRSEKA